VTVRTRKTTTDNKKIQRTLSKLTGKIYAHLLTRLLDLLLRFIFPSFFFCCNFELGIENTYVNREEERNVLSCLTQGVCKC